MENNPTNRNERNESESVRRARRSLLRMTTWADVVNEPREPLIIVQTTILSFVILVLFLTPILVSLYAAIYSCAAELKLFYQIIVYPIMPDFPHSEVAKCCMSYLNTFLVAALVVFIIFMWRTTYSSIHGAIELMYNGELLLL